MTDATVYIPVASVDVADRLSRGVYRLSRPVGHRPEDYRTTHAFGWLVYPQTGAVVLALDPTQRVHCHKDADPTVLLEIVQDVTDEQMRALLAAYIVANAGGTVPVKNLIPPAALAEALTHQQLEAAGWFQSPV